MSSGNFTDFMASGGGKALFGNSTVSALHAVANQDYIILDGGYDAKGGGGGGGGRGGNPGGTTGTEPTVTDVYISGDPNVDDSLEFNITIEFMGDWPDYLKVQFEAAADFLSTVIIGDMPDIVYNGQAIDDIVIQASLTNIDGTGGVLGQAGPTVVRSADYTPIMGVMEFDIADAEAYSAAGLFDDIILHEMMHVLGFGTLWNYNGLVETAVVDDNGTKKPTDDIVESYYIGEAVLAAYNGDGFVFVETDGGSGTAGGHWDEETYQLELMTGYIGYYDPLTSTWSGDNYLEAWSLAALADLGYMVDPNLTGLDAINLV